MAKGFAPPKRFRAKSDLRQTLEINFRFLAYWLNDTFSAYDPPFVPYAPRMWRGQGELMPILNRNWKYTVNYINTFVSQEPVLAGVRGFAPWPPFKGADETEEDLSELQEAKKVEDGYAQEEKPKEDLQAISVMVAKNFEKLVTYINSELAPLL